MAVRNMGKAAFLRIHISMLNFTRSLQKEALPEAEFSAFKLADVGDIVGVIGTPMKTKTGELSLKVTHFRMLTKSLRPLPEKWHGLSNVEQRYRQRYLDLIVNEKTRSIFRNRIKIIRGIQKFLDDRGFIEVETPILSDIAGGAEARPFFTHHNALDEDLSLRIATELHLKRCVVGGIERVYEIGRLFRNEGVSTRHNPEFTSIEFYQAYATYDDLMTLTEELLRGLAVEVVGSGLVPYGEHMLDFQKPFRRAPIAELVAEFFSFDAQKTKELINIVSVKNALELCFGHMVSASEPFAICLRELDLEEMKAILPASAELGQEKLDLAALAKALAKDSGKDELLALGKRIDEALADFPVRRRRLALHLLYGNFDHEVEDSIIQPTFITDFSVSVSPLARKRDGDEAVVDRFELIVARWKSPMLFPSSPIQMISERDFYNKCAKKSLGIKKPMNLMRIICMRLKLACRLQLGKVLVLIVW